jgi:hypothetical protein
MLHEEYNLTMEIASFVVLSLTLVVLLVYTIDTHRIAEQTVEANLRPIILRNGWIIDWKVASLEDMNDVKVSLPHFLEFINEKNIAQEIRGFIIINGKKHDLLFSNNTPLTLMDFVGDSVKPDLVIGFAPVWGWLPKGGKLHATFSNEKFTETTDSNQIYLKYKDIEGNPYYTKEDNNFLQISAKSR